MNLWTMLRILLKAMLARIVPSPEDAVPRLGQAMEKQRALLARARSGLVDIAATRTHLEQQARTLHAWLPRFEDRARVALAVGREDQARIALQRRLVVVAELELLDGHLVEITAEERRLTDAVLRLAAQLDGFVLRSDISAARSLVADSGARVRAALRSMDGEMADLTTHLRQAEEWTRQMEDRAAAIDALMNTNSYLEIGAGTPAQRELSRMEHEQATENRLAELKTHLAQTCQKEQPSQASTTIP